VIADVTCVMGSRYNEMDNSGRKLNDTAAEMASVDQSRHKSVARVQTNSSAVPHSEHNSKFSDEMDGPLTTPVLNENGHESVKLPQVFNVKYLGKREARGLWGIKYTRKPVDDMVTLAKTLPTGVSLPFLQFKVDAKGVSVSEKSENSSRDFETGFYPVDIISYGVQDLIYTRVFSMIVVRDTAVSASAVLAGATPFECYAYVCDSRQSARMLTIALATAFQEFSRSVKHQKMKPKRIAIDLRTPEEMALELEDLETEA